jgi:hypothetical protein
MQNNRVDYNRTFLMANPEDINGSVIIVRHVRQGPSISTAVPPSSLGASRVAANVRQWIRGQRFLLGLALVDELLDAVARSHQHVAPSDHVRLVRELAMAGHDLGLVVRRFDVGVGGADQAPDVAAIGEVWS